MVASNAAFAVDFSGYVGIQQRWFVQDALYSEQDDLPTSVNLEPEWYHAWNQGNDSVTFKPYLRLDSEDSERSHGDIRELYWLHVGDGWEFGAGISKVYWGVTESQHLVDIINQTDLVEAPDGEEKLGQTMLRYSTVRNWGIVDLFVLPGFRPRTFPGEEGRLRPALTIDQNNPVYQSSAEERHVDIAARWAQTLDDWDVSLSYFRGTSREPSFNLISKNGELQLQPFYPQIEQYGGAAQLTTGSWLWKLESIFRHSDFDDYGALTGGFEYTLFGIFDQIWDLGLLTEYSYDSRDEDTTTGLQNDLFVGGRLSFNDMASSEVLFGITQDLDHSASYSALVEASTRIGDATKIYFEVWLFDSDNPADPIYSLRRDNYLEVSIEYYF